MFKHHLLPVLSVISMLFCLPASAQVLKATEFITGIPGSGDINTLAIPPDGKHLYTFSDRLGVLGTFAINQQTGSIDLLDTQAYETEFFPIATNVIFTADSQWAYIRSLETNLDTSRIPQLYSRNATTGQLTLVDNNALNLTPEESIGGIALSPDSNFLYAYISINRSRFLRVFSIAQPDTPDLVQNIEISMSGFLNSGVFIPADGNHVYLNKIDDYIYNRDPMDGTLSLANDNSVQFQNLLLSNFSDDGELLLFTVGLPTSPPITAVGTFSRDRQSGLLNPGLSLLSFSFSTTSQIYHSFIAEDQYVVRIVPFSLFLLDRENNRSIELNNEIEDELTTGPLSMFGTQVVTPDGRFYYRSVLDGLTIFRIDPSATRIPDVPTLGAAGLLIAIFLMLASSVAFSRKKQIKV